MVVVVVVVVILGNTIDPRPDVLRSSVAILCPLGRFCGMTSSPSEPAKAAGNSLQPISEGGRIWQERKHDGKKQTAEIYNEHTLALDQHDASTVVRSGCGTAVQGAS